MAVHLLDLVGRGDERATELPGMVTAQLEGFRVADLSWSIVQATASRNGIPPHAPTPASPLPSWKPSARTPWPSKVDDSIRASPVRCAKLNALFVCAVAKPGPDLWLMA